MKAEESLLISILISSISVACAMKATRQGVPAEVEAVIGTVSDDITQAQYEKIYNEAADEWRHDSTLEQSNAVFNTLKIRLGGIENRVFHSATERHDSGGLQQGHFFIVTYQTKFERGEGMETFTLAEHNGRWLLARYFVNSTALK